MKKNKDTDKLWAISVGIILIILALYTIYKDYSVSENKKTVIGEIINFQHRNLSYYYIEYKYTVDKKIYTGSCGVSGDFICNNGKEGCVGEKFTVYYSSTNPSYSKIDLGQYEEFKTTVEFFD
ncbi:DUF3592 domain-containing protein [uncultured Maribacter sp.]|uniref:DUF3592 domain-containing protein n=1 Tax=uncultured Maribacter sp. TaxID=431308 RepID=UPI0026063068|nr:DUF3592 domain-containing protein [uncultured Maribacter sp.]